MQHMKKFDTKNSKAQGHISVFICTCHQG